MRRRIAIAAVSTGSVAPSRGKVARKARTRKIASIRSPRACLMASAASSRSYSEPSFITRSTASVSCASICAVVISGSAGSPRRSCASSRCAFSIARSPPFAATYISGFLRNAYRARQRRDRLVRRQQQIDPARKERAVRREPRHDVGRQRIGTEPAALANAGAGEHEAGVRLQRLDLQDQCGRAVGIIGGAEIEGGEVGNGPAREREGGARRVRDDLAAAVEAEPSGDIVVGGEIG